MKDIALCNKMWVETSQKALRNELYSHLFLGLALRTSKLDMGRFLFKLGQMSNILKTCVIHSIYDTFNDTGCSSGQGYANPGRLRFFFFTAGTFLGPQYGTAFMSPVWRPEY